MGPADRLDQSQELALITKQLLYSKGVTKPATHCSKPNLTGQMLQPCFWEFLNLRSLR